MDETGKQPRAPGRWARILLVASLALNLLIVGAVAGAMLSGGKWRAGPPGAEAVIGPLTRALDAEDRRAIGREIRRAWRDGELLRGRHDEAFEGLIADLTATPFDPAAVEARLAAIRGVIQERLSLGQALLIERLTAMDPAGRAAYADRLREAMRHHRHHH